MRTSIPQPLKTHSPREFMKKVIFIFIFLLLIGYASASKRVLIDEYYAQENTLTEKDNTFFLGKLSALGYTVDINKEKLTRERLAEYDILMLQNPARVLEKSEQDAILGFVKKGGGLIILGQWTRGAIGWNDDSRISFNELAQNFGVTFDATAVDDNTNKAGCHCTPIIHMIKSHMITENVKNIVMYWPCSLSIKDAEVLATGDDDTQATGIKDSKRGEEVILAVAAEYGGGRVVVVGTSGVFADRWAQEPEWDNVTFGLNIFAWVGENAGKNEVNLSGFAIAIVYLLLVIGVFETVDRVGKVREKNH